MALAPLCRILVTPSSTHNQIGPLWCWLPSGWACACSKPLWVSPTNSPVRLGVSPTTVTPTDFYSQGFWDFISLCYIPGLHCLSSSPVVPPSLSARECGTTLSDSCCLAVSPLCPGCPWTFLLWLLGCQTSIQFYFLSVLVVFCF